MDIKEPYNPLDKRNLGISVADALLAKEPSRLPPISQFDGAGIYAIYYTGDFPPYRALSALNKGGELRFPIYVGKAVPEGARKGGLGFDVSAGPVLYRRLGEHSKSIEQASNLILSDFFCRYLTVDDIWIPLGESLLVSNFSPLWNLTVDGFGNHDPGGGRYNQQIAPWDIIHPGRLWAKNLKPGKSEALILASIKEHLKRYI